jgi:hypothetical protein
VVHDRLEALERLAAHVEIELRRERRERKRDCGKRRPPGRPPNPRGPADHGTETDYQAESWVHRKHDGPPPCDLCKAAHALYNRRRAAERKRLGLAVQHREPVDQLTIYDVLEA